MIKQNIKTQLIISDRCYRMNGGAPGVHSERGYGSPSGGQAPPWPHSGVPGIRANIFFGVRNFIVSIPVWKE